MPIVTMPKETLWRLKDRLDAIAQHVDMRIFAASTMVPGLIFTSKEIKGFGGDKSEAVVVALPDLDVLTAAIPPEEGDQLNYVILTHPRAIARLDPFA